jgi:hypothetical protein
LDGVVLKRRTGAGAMKGVVQERPPADPPCTDLEGGPKGFG